MQLKDISLALAATLVTTFGATSVTAEIDEKKFEAVGGNSSSFWWLDYEKPFYETGLPEASDGKLTANAVSYTELGLSGFEVLNLLELGTYDFAQATLGYVTQDSPALEGTDLPGVVKDTEQYREVIDAYRPIMQRELAKTANSRLMVMAPWPPLQVMCNFPERSEPYTLADLAGKKTRSFSTAVSDFLEGLGAVPVTMSFSEVVPALQRGVLDCVLTSPSGAYTSKLYQVVTHNYVIPAGFASWIIVMNEDTYQELSPETKTVLDGAFAELEERIWEKAAQHEAEVTECLNQTCPIGEAGNMTRITPTPEEIATIEQIASDVVVKKFAGRCPDEQCVTDWNETIGQIVGISASR